MKYIDAEKLIAEIEALKRRKGFLPFENTEITEAYMARGVQFTCDDIVNLIQSLQHEQPVVDLEKEINIEISKWTCYEEIGFGARYDAKPFDGRDIEKIARHFYELGLTARK
jgi:hypothetical protein